MRTCEEYEALISALMDGALEDEDRRELMAHMADCPDCQAYFNDQLTIRAALGSMEAQAPAGFTAQVMERVRQEPRQVPDQQKNEKKTVAFPYWRRYAAMAACCAIVAVAGFWAFGNGQSTAGNMVAADTASVMDERCAVPSEEVEENESAGVADAAAEDVTVDAVLDSTADAVMPEDAPADDVPVNDVPVESQDAPVAEQQTTVTERDETRSDREEPSVGQTVAPPADDAPAGEGKVFPSMYAAAGETVTLTTDSQLAEAWVEENLGQAWEAGASYTLTVEQFDQVQALLQAHGESFTLARPLDSQLPESDTVDNEEDTEEETPVEEQLPDDSASTETAPAEAVYVLQAAP